jgi:hypothetical protein
MFAGKWGKGRACSGQDDTDLVTCKIIPFVIRGTTEPNNFKYQEKQASFGGA